MQAHGHTYGKACTNARHTHTHISMNAACSPIPFSTGLVICTGPSDSEGFFDGGFTCIANYSYNPATAANPQATCTRMLTSFQKEPI